jgi:heme/copper-type cytochrome/quinol oxidase subunit 4
MMYIFWVILGLIVAAGIYWLMDWQSHHEDGE